jgi:DNA-binding CsgD family transcriptional regulator
LFALSRAEARLGALLLQDRSLCESAQELGVSLNTVRTQLKKLFEKDGHKSATGADSRSAAESGSSDSVVADASW